MKMGTMTVFAVALGLMVSTAATAELNLWVSQYYGGLEAYEDGAYQDAGVLLQAALGETQTKHRRAVTLDELGQVHAALGHFNESQRYYQQALDLKQRSLGRRHRDVAVTLNNLGDLQYLLGNHENVEALYRDALDINRRDQLNIEVCRSLNGLALVADDAGDAVQAENHLKRAVEIHERAERREHPYLATVLTNLGILCMKQGRYGEAEAFYARAKYIQDLRLRADHPDVAVRLHATAALYAETGRVDAGRKLAQQAEEIRRKQQAAGNLY